VLLPPALQLLTPMLWLMPTRAVRLLLLLLLLVLVLVLLLLGSCRASGVPPLPLIPSWRKAGLFAKAGFSSLYRRSDRPLHGRQSEPQAVGHRSKHGWVTHRSEES